MPGAHRGRVPSLDGLRAISILLVTVSHLLGTTNFPLAADALLAVGDLGYLGVRIFFVISGYLITNLLIGEHAKTGRISLADFYIRRAYRILPAAYALIASIALASWVGALSVDGYDLLAAATYTTNYHYDRAWELGHLWSLSVEEQFYLLWPVLLVIFGRRVPATAQPEPPYGGGAGSSPLVPVIVPLAAAMLVTAPIFRALAWHYLERGDDVMEQAYPCVMDSIAAGCLLAGARPWLDRSRVYKWFTAGPGFVAVLAAIVLSQLPTHHVLLDSVVDVSVQNIALAILVDRFVRYPGGPAGKVLNWRPVMFVGTLSYSLYLWQEPFLNHHVHRSTTAWPVNVVLAIACALGSYYLVEKPFLALRERRRARKVSAAPPP